MEIRVRTNISEKYEDIEIILNAREKTPEVIELENELLKLNLNAVENIIGYRDNNIFIIDVKDVITFFSYDKCNYLRTKDGEFRVKETLTSLEDILSKKKFIRISNSVIANIDKIEYFNTNIVGNILIKFTDGTEEYVSRRRIKSVMEFLRNRRR